MGRKDKHGGGSAMGAQQHTRGRFRVMSWYIIVGNNTLYNKQKRIRPLGQKKKKSEKKTNMVFMSSDKKNT